MPAKKVAVKKASVQPKKMFPAVTQEEMNRVINRAADLVEVDPHCDYLQGFSAGFVLGYMVGSGRLELYK